MGERQSKLLGAAVRKLREEQGISQEAFADKIGMHRAYFGAIERGHKNVTLLTLSRISSGLGVKASRILQEAGI